MFSYPFSILDGMALTFRYKFRNLHLYGDAVVTYAAPHPPTRLQAWLICIPRYFDPSLEHSIGNVMNEYKSVRSEEPHSREVAPSQADFLQMIQVDSTAELPSSYSIQLYPHTSRESGKKSFASKA